MNKPFIISLGDNAPVNLFAMDDFLRKITDRNIRSTILQAVADGRIGVDSFDNKHGLPEGSLDLVRMFDDPELELANNFARDRFEELRASKANLSPAELKKEISQKHEALFTRYPGAKRFVDSYSMLIQKSVARRRGPRADVRILPAQCVFAFSLANVVVIVNAFAVANAMYFANANALANANAAANANAITNTNTMTDDSSSAFGNESPV